MKLNTAVKKVIENNIVKTQTDLTELLKKAGFKTTQSNLSRVLKKVGAVKKTDDKGQSFYIIQEKPLEVEPWVGDIVKNIKNNGYNIVIMTYSGAANMVCEIIDEQKFEEVMGTVAGDNSIIIAPNNIDDIEFLTQKLEKLFFIEE